ncbi:MAG: type 4a pilus biogenesis protein PilO [Elusimicrobiota bacterium]
MKIAMTKERQEKIMLVILAFGLLWAAKNYFYSPLGEKLKFAKEDLKEKTERYEFMKSRAFSMELLKKDITLLNEYVVKTKNKLPREKEIPALIKLISSKMDMKNIVLNALVPEKVVLVQNYYELPFKVDVIAGYHDLAVFFTLLGNSDRIMHVKDLRITANQITKDEPQTLRATFTLVAYAYRGG